MAIGLEGILGKAENYCFLGRGEVRPPPLPLLLFHFLITYSQRRSFDPKIVLIYPKKVLLGGNKVENLWEFSGNLLNFNQIPVLK